MGWGVRQVDILQMAQGRLGVHLVDSLQMTQGGLGCPPSGQFTNDTG